MAKLTFSSIKKPVNFLALGFGSGLAPRAPGTAGTLLAWLLALFFPVLLNGYVVMLTSLLGIYICGYTARQLKTHDHPGIVWDEFCGIWITLYFLNKFNTLTFPIYAIGEHLNMFFWWLAALFSFRFFDIVKPWPIGYIDTKVKGGFGIMLDDVVAALMAVIFLLAALYLIGQTGK